MAWTHEVYTDAALTETLTKRVVIQYIAPNGAKTEATRREITYGSEADLASEIRGDLAKYETADTEKPVLPKKGTIINLALSAPSAPTALQTFASLVEAHNTLNISLGLGVEGVTQKQVDDALAAVKAAYVVSPAYAAVAQGLR